MSETTVDALTWVDDWHIEATWSDGRGKGYCVTCGPDDSPHWPCPVRQVADQLATSRAALEDVQWQEAHPSIEVVSRRCSEDDEKPWVAYDRGGNVNDTEWFAIAEGDTWQEAIQNARRAQEARNAKP